jgi:hypothetical protein
MLWCVKPQTVLIGNTRVEFRLSGNHWARPVIEITEDGITRQVRFSAGGDVIHIGVLPERAETAKV